MTGPYVTAMLSFYFLFCTYLFQSSAVAGNLREETAFKKILKRMKYEQMSKRKIK